MITLFVFISTPFLISYWYSKSVDISHKDDISFYEFTNIINSNPAFSSVKSRKVPYKIRYLIEGTVESKEDLKELKILADKYGVYGIQDIGIK